MRIDKYLKVSHVIKRREMAKKMLDAGMITINEKVAKPASEVKPSDVILITNPSGKTLKIKVLETREHCPLEKTSEMYEII